MDISYPLVLSQAKHRGVPPDTQKGSPFFNTRVAEKHHHESRRITDKTPATDFRRYTAPLTFQLDRSVANCQDFAMYGTP